MLLRFASATDNLSLLSQPIRQSFSVLRLSARPRVRTYLSAHSSPTCCGSQTVFLRCSLFWRQSLKLQARAIQDISRSRGYEFTLPENSRNRKITNFCGFSVQNLSSLWRSVEKQLQSRKLHRTRCRFSLILEMANFKNRLSILPGTR